MLNVLCNLVVNRECYVYTVCVFTFYLECCLVDILQEEITELELPTDTMEMVFVKLAELKQVRDFVIL